MLVKYELFEIGDIKWAPIDRERERENNIEREGKKMFIVIKRQRTNLFFFIEAFCLYELINICSFKNNAETMMIK